MTAFRPRIDRPALQAAIAFLSALERDAGRAGAEAATEVDQDAARLAIAACLNLKDPQSPMGHEMYNAFTPHATNLAVEGVCFRTNPASGRIDVWLQRRPDSDYRDRGKLAGPGQGIRVSDDGPEDALERLTRLEFKVPTTYEFIGDVFVPHGLRGWYECKVYLAFPQSEPPDAEWYPTDPLPAPREGFTIVPSHRERIIPFALAAYKKRAS